MYTPPNAAALSSQTYFRQLRIHWRPMSPYPSCNWPTKDCTVSKGHCRVGWYPATHNLNTLGAYLVCMLYPSLCLVSPAITVKSAPAMARIVPPFSVYGLKACWIGCVIETILCRLWIKSEVKRWSVWVVEETVYNQKGRVMETQVASTRGNHDRGPSDLLLRVFAFFGLYLFISHPGRLVFPSPMTPRILISEVNILPVLRSI